MKSSSLFRLACLVVFSLSIGCFAYLNYLSNNQADMEVENIEAVEVNSGALESGASMLLHKVISGSRNMLTN